jgi:hypothetical protein
MPPKELNLLQFTTSLMAKTRASPAKVVRGEKRNLTVLCFLLYNTPNDLGAESCSSNPAIRRDKKHDADRHFGLSYVPAMIGAHARAATVRIAPSVA